MKVKKTIEARTFNIMQYQAHPTTGEKLLSEKTIKEALDKYKTISEWAYILHDKDIKEDGTLKPPHFHVVIRTSGNATPLSSVASWFKIPPVPAAFRWILRVSELISISHAVDKKEYL